MVTVCRGFIERRFSLDICHCDLWSQILSTIDLQISFTIRWLDLVQKHLILICQIILWLHMMIKTCHTWLMFHLNKTLSINRCSTKRQLLLNYPKSYSFFTGLIIIINYSISQCLTRIIVIVSCSYRWYYSN